MNDEQRWDDTRFWLQVLGDAKRTIVCPPGLEALIRAGLRARGLDALNEVVMSTHCPDNAIIIVDQQALDAAHNAAMQQLSRRPYGE